MKSFNIHLGFLRPLLCLLLCLVAIPFLGIAQFDRDEIQVVLEEWKGPIHFFDGDNDGDLDLLQIARSANGNILYFENIDGLGKFGVPIHSGDTCWWNYPSIKSNTYSIADMDADGFEDVVPHNRIFQPQPYFRNLGNGRFIHPLAARDINREVSHYRFDIGKMTPEGAKDIFIYDFVEQVLYINHNQGVDTGFVLQEVSNFQIDIDEDKRFLNFKVVDLNLDGSDDLLFFYYNKNVADRHLVLLPFLNEAGLFSALSPFIVDSTASSSSNVGSREIHFVDVNSDGYPDLTIGLDGCFLINETKCQDDLLLVLKNEGGTGIFTEIGRVRRALSSQVADVNLDGKVEIIASIGGLLSNFNGYKAFTIQNDSFETVTILDTNGVSSLKVIVDLNVDSYPDLVVDFQGNNSSGTLSYYKNLGNRTIGFGNIEMIGPVQNSYSNLRITHNKKLLDWDADGDLDLLLYGSGVLVLRNVDGLGHFAPPELLWFNSEQNLIPDFATGNISNDHRLDFFGAYDLPYTDDPNDYHQGVLGISDSITGAYTTIILEEIEVAFIPFLGIDDFDQDKDQDLLIAQSDGGLAIAWNQLSETGNFDVEQNILPSPPLDSLFVSMYYEDINGDGYKDFVGQFNSGRFYWTHHLDGKGTFEEWQTLPGNPYIPGSLGTLLLEDFDGDGDLDALFSNYALCLYDEKSNSFQELIPLNTAPEIWPAFPYDINGDGASDLLTKRGVSLSSPQTGYLTNPYLPTADGNFPDEVFSIYPRIGDIDNDGTLEVLFGYGNIYAFGYGNIYAYNLDFLPASSVQGHIRRDTSLSCTYKETQLPLSNWLVSIENDSFPQIANTNGRGFYGALLNDTLDYRIKPIPPSAYWEICPSDTLLEAPLLNGVDTINFVAEAVVDCAILDVDLTSTKIRQCFNSTVFIKYTNIGTERLPDARIVLSFDRRFTPINSTLPWEIATDTTLTFSLNDVEIGASDQIAVEFMPDCQGMELGEIVCFSTAVTPDSLCQDPYLEWDGANLEASSFCNGDSLAFVITNTGQGEMQVPQPIEVDIINDDIVIFLIDETQLRPGQSDTLQLPVIEQTTRLHLDQPRGHPLPEPINLLAESCATNTEGNFAGLLTLPNEQGNPFVNTLYKEVKGPFGSNIKTAIPQGLGESHLIEKDWRIDYTIEFQNTGTDAARNVYLRDTLSPFLDLSTFKFKGASHPVNVQLLPNRELHFIFSNINLPDSTTNEPGSHGFVTFSIVPNENTLPLSLIKNRAGIYFDFNEPVITDYVYHTIRKPQVISTIKQDVCIGGIFNDVPILADTVLQELHVFPEQDSIIWHYVSAKPNYTTDTTILLQTPTEYNGVYIIGDTTLTFHLQSEYGCDSLARVAFDLITSVQELPSDGSIRVYPIPTFNEVHISWDKNRHLVEQIDLVSFNGKKLFSKVISPFEESESSINIKDHPPGLYWLVIQTRDQTMHLKITKS